MSETRKDKKRIFTDLITTAKKKKSFFLWRFLYPIAKTLLGCTFLPVFVFSNIIENRVFLRTIKILFFLIYVVFIALCLYTVVTRNILLGTTEKVIVEIDFKNRIKEFE
ncbi:MAG: hypothetical protein LBI70_00025 [Rickettsiales bacterium]|jgi:hypothetical protein|nr:hypothetical protein [Rickettsiales bacterium]